VQDTIYPYKVPVYATDPTTGETLLEADGTPVQQKDEQGELVYADDPRWWVKLKEVKTYDMQLRAQSEARIRKNGKWDIDETKATYIVWAMMIVDGVVPDARTGEPIRLVEDGKPRFDRYPRLSQHVGVAIDLAVGERDGSDPSVWTVAIQGKETDFR
jgi:hypothetical protein